MTPEHFQRADLSNLAGAEPGAPTLPGIDAPRIAFILAGAIVVTVAGLLGGMQYVILAFAVGLAVFVSKQPKEAISSGILFMLVAMVFLPSTARLQFLDSRTIDVSWQMYFWAVGSLIVVASAVRSIGLRALARTPAALKVFFLVAIVSSVFGFTQKNAPGYVFGELFGTLLFILYFAIACAVGDEELLFERMKTFGVLIAFAFFVYYASVFSQFGFHKEDTSLTSQMGLVATFLFSKGLIERRRSWFIPSAILLGASMLFFMRHIVLTFLFAMVLIAAVRNGSRIRKVLCYGVAAIILLPSIFPFGAQYVLDTLEEKQPGIYALLPEGTTDSKTLLDRNIELFAGAVVLVGSPILGGGMGGNLTWYRPDESDPVDKAYIDNGWAYLMVKMGAVGILAFGWLLVTVLRCISRQSLALSVTLLAILMIAMFSEPICFQFTTSPIAGVLAGLLYVKKHGTILPADGGARA